MGASAAFGLGHLGTATGAGGALGSSSALFAAAAAAAGLGVNPGGDPLNVNLNVNQQLARLHSLMTAASSVGVHGHGQVGGLPAFPSTGAVGGDGAPSLGGALNPTAGDFNVAGLGQFSMGADPALLHGFAADGEAGGLQSSLAAYENGVHAGADGGAMADSGDAGVAADAADQAVSQDGAGGGGDYQDGAHVEGQVDVSGSGEQQTRAVLPQWLRARADGPGSGRSGMLSSAAAEWGGSDSAATVEGIDTSQDDAGAAVADASGYDAAGGIEPLAPAAPAYLTASAPAWEGASGSTSSAAALSSSSSTLVSPKYSVTAAALAPTSAASGGVADSEGTAVPEGISADAVPWEHTDAVAGDGGAALGSATLASGGVSTSGSAAMNASAAEFRPPWA